MWGQLLADPESGTALKVAGSDLGGFPYDLPPIGSTVPIRWPSDYTGRRLLGGEVAISNADGQVVATTGTLYEVAPPVYGDRFVEGGAFPACISD